MEINLVDSETTCGETQAYWLLAIKAAKRAFIRYVASRQQGEADSTTTGRDVHDCTSIYLACFQAYPGLKEAVVRGEILSRCSGLRRCLALPSAYEDPFNG